MGGARHPADFGPQLPALRPFKPVGGAIGYNILWYLAPKSATPPPPPAPASPQAKPSSRA